MDQTVWKEPTLVAKSDLATRPDQDNHIDASEYLDDETTLLLKVKAVASLLRSSKHCVCYTGAGISKSSGIPDYATRATKSVVSGIPRLKNPMDAQPTAAHDALASLYRAGFVKEFVNQNHDALFEKAGVPVMHSNLIHGDWFDVGNNVVQFSENLREDLFDRLLESEANADLVLVAGTSLSGMNADRIALTCAKRARQKKSLGVVLVNLQKTCLDKNTAARIWSKTDDFFPMLAQELNCSMVAIRPEPILQSVFSFLYYDHEGKRKESPGEPPLVLDLSPGARVVVSMPLASSFGKKMTVANERDLDGNWIFEAKRPGKFTVKHRLGRWYILAAMRGEIEFLPVINQE